MKKILILFLSIILFMVGCISEKPEVEYALEDLKEYFNIRYSELTAENFAKRSEKMNAYYSDELLSSDSWLLDSLNYESTLHTLEEIFIKNRNPLCSCSFALHDACNIRTCSYQSACCKRS